MRNSWLLVLVLDCGLLFTLMADTLPLNKKLIADKRQEEKRNVITKPAQRIDTEENTNTDPNKLENCLYGTSYSFVDDYSYTIYFFGSVYQNSVSIGSFYSASYYYSYSYYPLTGGTYCSATGANRFGEIYMYCTSDANKFAYVEEYQTCEYTIYIGGPRYCSENYDSSCKYTGDDSNVSSTVAGIIAGIVIPLFICGGLCMVCYYRQRQRYEQRVMPGRASTIATVPAAYPTTAQVNAFQPPSANTTANNYSAIGQPIVYTPSGTAVSTSYGASSQPQYAASSVYGVAMTQQAPTPQYSMQYGQPGQQLFGQQQPAVMYSQPVSSGQYGQPTMSASYVQQPVGQQPYSNGQLYAQPTGMQYGAPAASYVPVAQAIH